MTISETQLQRTETHAQRQTGRSIMAVVVGIVAGVLPILTTDAVLHATHVFPRLGQAMSTDSSCSPRPTALYSAPSGATLSRGSPRIDPCDTRSSAASSE